MADQKRAHHRFVDIRLARRHPGWGEISTTAGVTRFRIGANEGIG
ncbi:MAG: hypothetical protein ACTS5I_00820 [Rhodanobacter sp.]